MDCRMCFTSSTALFQFTTLSASAEPVPDCVKVFADFTARLATALDDEAVDLVPLAAVLVELVGRGSRKWAEVSGNSQHAVLAHFTTRILGLGLPFLIH